MDLPQTLYPQNAPVGPHDAERGVKGVVRLRVQDLVPEFEHLRAVFLVHTAQPGFKRGRLSRGQTVYLAEAIIPIDATGADIPHPAAPSRGLESETEPLFAFPQRLFGQLPLGDV